MKSKFTTPEDAARFCAELNRQGQRYTLRQYGPEEFTVYGIVANDDSEFDRFVNATDSSSDD